MSEVFLLVAEDHLCAVLARDLCDRVIAEHVPKRARDEWLNDRWEGWKTWEVEDPNDTSGPPRKWAKFSEGGDSERWWSTRSEVPRDVQVRPVPGEGRHAALARKAMLAALKMSSVPTALVIAHDTQGEEGLRERIRAAVERSATGGDGHLPVLLAIMHQESNAWVVAGFVPDARGAKRLEDEKTRLPFDPVQYPHRLTPGRAIAKTDAKRVSVALLHGDGRDDVSPEDERVRACWRETPLEVLERNGRETGLPEYLADVTALLLPALRNRPR